MELYSITLPNVAPIKMISARASYGIGFITRIVSWFCDLIGIPCDMYTKKMDKVNQLAMDNLRCLARNLDADGIMDVHCQIDKLSILVYGTAYKLSAEEKARREGEMQTRREAEKRAKREAEARAKREAEEKARRLDEKRAKAMSEARARFEAEVKARLQVRVEKPNGFVFKQAWEDEIKSLPFDTVYQRFIDEERWNESYRYICYLDLKERGY